MDATTWVALLRGVNVGGKNRLPMADLAAMFTSAGCENVRTYIQSGNVIFRAPVDLALALPDLISDRIAQTFGHRPPVLLRSAAALSSIVAANPFLSTGLVAEETLHVMFLATEPDPELVSTLDPLRSPPDLFRVLGSEVYLHTPHGLARTRLTNAYFDSRLATTSTIRNWKTVGTLRAMMTGLKDAHFEGDLRCKGMSTGIPGMGCRSN